jgi:hypothetical protein
MSMARCDSCERDIDTDKDVDCYLTDPWDRLTGECLCENCRERRWDRYQEYLMETT